MPIDLRAPLGAMLLLALVSPAWAGKAVSSADMTMRSGPGEQYKTLMTIAAGSTVDLRECDAAHWCRIEHRDITGWVHVKRVDKPRGGSGGTGKPGATQVSETIMGGDLTDKKGTVDRSRPGTNTGGNNFSRPSPSDAVALQGGGNRFDTGGDSGGSGGGSGGEGSQAAALATETACGRC